MKKLCVLFAGPIGSGKSPIANYLSYKLDLPIFNHDTMRVEVMEDLLMRDEKEFERRRDLRLNELIQLGREFIYDASIDRSWKVNRKRFLESNYLPFIISLNFSKKKLTEIYKAKGYTEFGELDRTFKDHQLFLEEFGDKVSLSLNDEHFSNRLELCFVAVSEFRKKLK